MQGSQVQGEKNTHTHRSHLHATSLTAGSILCHLSQKLFRSFFDPPLFKTTLKFKIPPLFKPPAFSPNDEPTCSDSREVNRKPCILSPWKRGSELCRMVSVCHHALGLRGREPHVPRARVAMLGNALQVTGSAAFGATEWPELPGIGTCANGSLLPSETFS